jgi:predicted NAD-dependent protein-ADP-ribosyltransferase YbiA (DUF1768 family)
MSTHTDMFLFYSKSRDAKPGKGAKAERVLDPSAYAELASIKDWRRVLSNFHVMPFKYAGLRWRSIEHAFQAEKLGRVDPALRYKLSIDSGSDVGALGDGAAARKMRKAALLTPQQLDAWNNGESDAAMADIARAKYMQCPEAMRVLKATGKAQLWHVMPRSKPVRFMHLEAIRHALRYANRDNSATN